MTKQTELEKEFDGQSGNAKADHAGASATGRGRSGSLGLYKSHSPTRQNKSRSPMRPSRQKQKNKSRSPVRQRQHNNKSRSPIRGHYNSKAKKKPAAMTVIVNRCDLWDSAAHFQPDECYQPQNQHALTRVLPYRYAADEAASESFSNPGSPRGPPPGMEKQDESKLLSVATARVPHQVESIQFPIQSNHQLTEGMYRRDVIDTLTPNPHDPNIVHDKYWAQRRRLFSRFDRGIQLDAEGWFSVTPEIIADHVAERVSSLVTTSPAFQQKGQTGNGVVILDGFCGCGGNAIAFGKIHSHIVSKVVCVDTDYSKLLKAAHNASLYDIPRDKLIFIHCNSIFILKYCYKDGEFILDQPQPNMPQYMPPPVVPTIHAGYVVGGLDMLPRHIDLAFFDPPWGGIDYEILGKNGYDLERNMKIQVNMCEEEKHDEPEEDDCGISDDFFDTFAAPKPQYGSKRSRKRNFNKKTEGEYVNGKELIKLAAEAVRSRVVLLDLPRNTSKNSLGSCALGAGYRGNLKLEEHYLNGRLKTVTAYLGSDYSSLINEMETDAS
mmetsp:Transcript_26757/g.73607  ORF Transcript_26757/g.73607 Transcript_26757/m.73607 type:complete len:550 (-) Transcript_26757:377-2026(-)